MRAGAREIMGRGERARARGGERAAGRGESEELDQALTRKGAYICGQEIRREVRISGELLHAPRDIEQHTDVVPTCIDAPVAAGL